MGSKSRSEERSHVFLAASLDTGAKSIAVRVRNLSPGGALLDGPELPGVGTRVRLRRGALSAVGEISWQRKTQSGIKFDGDVDTSSWVQAVAHSQKRVHATPDPQKASGATRRKVQEPARVESLSLISAALDQICERLAGTPVMSVDCGDELLKLQKVAQSLRRLANRPAF